MQIVLYTHSINGISNGDIDLAVALDKLEVEYSPKWRKENESKFK